MALNEGIHAIPISNSSAKCLMENWVEERATKPLDGERDWLSVDTQKRGHKGIITLKENDKIEVRISSNGRTNQSLFDRCLGKRATAQKRDVQQDKCVKCDFNLDGRLGGCNAMITDYHFQFNGFWSSQCQNCGYSPGECVK